MTLNDFFNKIFPFRKKRLDDAFLRACVDGKPSLVRKLLKKGADINAKKDGVPAIVCAVRAGYPEVVMLLTENPKMNINAEDDKGETALYVAVTQGNASIIKNILKRDDADITKKPYASQNSVFQIAVLNGDYPLVHHLGKYDKINVNAQDEYGKTPLHYASKMKNADMFRFLLFHPKTNVNIQDNEGKTALYEAAEKGKQEYVHYLLLHPDINPNIQDREGNTPLHIATLLGHENVVQVLGLNSKVDLSVRNNIAKTAEETTPFYETRKNFLLIKRLRKSPNETFSNKNVFFRKQLEKKQSSR